jgi:hypothetical protein
MKLRLLIGLTLALGASVLAQDVRIEAPAAPKPAGSTTNALSAPIERPKEPLIKYSGLLTDFKRSTNRWKFFSLRKKADPKTDGENLIRETRTEASHPVKLLSLDF